MTHSRYRTYEWEKRVDWNLFHACVGLLSGGDMRRLQAVGFTWGEALNLVARRWKPTRDVFLRLCGAMHLAPDQLNHGWRLNGK